MKSHFTLARTVLFGLALSLAAALSAQRLQDRQLFLNGKATNVVILQLNGHSYIDIETLAQITNGSVKFEPTQIALSIPSTNVDANSPPHAPGLSKEFASAAIATLAEMKEWKGALGTMVNFGLAVDGSWVLSSMGGGEFLSSGQQRFDGLVAEHEQGSDGPQARRNGFVATGRADPLDDLFTAKFLQIVCCLAGAVGGWTLIAARASPGGQCGGGETIG